MPNATRPRHVRVLFTERTATFAAQGLKKKSDYATSYWIHKATRVFDIHDQAAETDRVCSSRHYEKKKLVTAGLHTCSDLCGV
jgi:hypothetical protein